MLLKENSRQNYFILLSAVFLYSYIFTETQILTDPIVNNNIVGRISFSLSFHVKVCLHTLLVSIMQTSKLKQFEIIHGER